MPDDSLKRKSRRTRVYIIIVALLIAAAGGYLYVYMKQTAALRASQHKHSFYEYVVTHQLGKLTLIDTGTGIDPMAYVLQLNQNVPDAKRVTFAENLAHLYAEYDHGSMLTIVYVDPGTHKKSVIAESHWDDDNKQLQLTVTSSSGQITQINQHVNW